MAQETNAGGDVPVFRPELKKIDVLNAEDFMERLLAFQKGSERLVLDLSAVRFIDSSGLGKIVSALRSLRDRGGDMRICGVQPPVMVLFSMVRLGEIVGIDADAAESAAKLAGGAGAGAALPKD